MENSGTALYLYGKKHNILYGVNIAGLGSILATSPRVGLIKIGKNIFKNLSKVPDPAHRDLTLILTLFHEARHSDGSGEEAGFIHEKCPSGEYKDIYACDNNANGGYSAEAELSRTVINSCENCPDTFLDPLRIHYMDRKSRVIAGFEDTYWDDRPEGKR
jgi:hypothetical protein